jgi:hypothetical protein
MRSKKFATIHSMILNILQHFQGKGEQLAIIRCRHTETKPLTFIPPGGATDEDTSEIVFKNKCKGIFITAKISAIGS